ncbi:acetylornithine deacetylase [Suttonella ornithocola]|uniref:Acetylornithine deacetylase n=1 Tax=Suttonella ornithocola TaxID=279832 RepID=A0A380MYX9_9GAMM|nr:acetylornithine deacetylase [Suttonella ornithocola]SUO97755.1 Acetylornithine deacetylase [Suttonella ornithocola]
MNYLEILEKLVSFNTISSESNLELIEWIENYLDQFEVYHERLSDKDGLPKASLIARIGNLAEGGLIFSGHTDVVPVNSQPWTDNPFAMRQSADKCIGRGVCDMKGFIACVLAGVPQWAQLSAHLQKPIYFAFSYDEEVGCDKAPAIAKRIKEMGGGEAWAIIGEPTLMQPVVGQKGIVNIRTVVTGQSAHSSQILHQGVSAVHEAAKLVTYIEQVMQDLQEDGELDLQFNVPHSSLHVGMIHGGIAHNVLARECYFDWEIRNLPSQTLDSIMARVDAYADTLTAANPALMIKTEYTTPIVPGLENRDNMGLLALVHQLLPDAHPECVAYATEAGQFQEAGYQAIILGPGSILQAHQPDEWIAIEQLEQCYQFLLASVKAHCQK